VKVCTYFDHRYLLRGLTLYRSLARHDPRLEFHVLSLDDRTQAALERLAWPGLHPMPLSALETGDHELVATRGERTLVEYYFTLTPAWARFALRSHCAPGETITLMDADLHFYSSPEAINAEVKGASMLVVGHRFPDHMRHLEAVGRYNVGLITFRNDAGGNAALDDWRTECIEWCHDRIEAGRFSDQKYLDAWPARYAGVRELRHPGGGLAPWNWMRFRIDDTPEGILVDDEPLVFYHFHAVRLFGERIYDSGTRPYGTPPEWLRRRLYDEYVIALRETRDMIEPAVGRFPLGSALSRTSLARYALAMLRDALRGRRGLYLAPR
jgi:hypothetical protein